MWTGYFQSCIGIERRRMGLMFLFCFFSLIEVYDCFMLESLVKNVFTDYGESVRPFCRRGSTVNVDLNLALRQIIDIDEPHQFLDSNIWIRMVWTDCRLTWNTSHYNGIDHVVLPQNRVWTPDITLYDNSANHNLGSIKDYQVTVLSDGTVKYNFPSVIRSLCSIDVTYFPFDSQKCRLKFGSWAYHDKDVNITNKQHFADLKSFVKNIEWEVVQVPAIRNAKAFDKDVYPTIDFYIHLRRRPLFYVMNLLFPCILISFVAVLGFLLPPDSGEKVNLEVTVLLSLAVFQLIVLEMMPPSGDSTPYLGIYFLLSLALVGCSCLMTVIVLKVHFSGRKQHRMPKWISACILRPLAKVLCMDLNGYLKPEKKWTQVCTERYRKNTGTENGGAFSITVRESNTQDTVIPSNAVAEYTTFCKHLEQISKSIDSMSSHIETHQNGLKITEEWHVLAVVLDRFFFFLYIILTVTGTLTLMLQYTHPPDG